MAKYFAVKFYTFFNNSNFVFLYVVSTKLWASILYFFNDSNSVSIYEYGTKLYLASIQVFKTQYISVNKENMLVFISSP